MGPTRGRVGRVPCIDSSQNQVIQFNGEDLLDLGWEGFGVGFLRK